MFNKGVADQDPRILKRFELWESVLSRYGESTYRQLLPLAENPQVLREQDDGQTLRALLCAKVNGPEELLVILSEVLPGHEEDVESWFSVGFLKRGSGETRTPQFLKTFKCPFCQQKTKFTDELHLDDMIRLYQCQRCRNFFETTAFLIQLLGVLICLFLSLFSLFSFLVGAYILAVQIWEGLIWSPPSIAGLFLLAGGAGTLFLLGQKIWQALSGPHLHQVSDFSLHFSAPEPGTRVLS